MTYDLSFFRKESDGRLSIDSLEKYFRTRKNYTVEDDAAFYEQPATGAGFFFHFQSDENNPFNQWRDVSCTRIDPASGEKLIDAGFSFEMNFRDTWALGLTAIPELKAVVKDLKLFVEDPHTQEIGDFDQNKFLAGLGEGNKMMASLQPLGFDAPSLSALAPGYLKWNAGNEERQNRLGDKIFSPRVMAAFFKRQLVSVAMWPDAIPVALPKVDYLFIGRMSILPKFLGQRKKEDIAVVAYKDVLPSLKSFPVQDDSPVPYHLLSYDKPPADVVKVLLRPSSPTLKDRKNPDIWPALWLGALGDVSR